MKLFHISDKYLGEEVILMPRVPPGQSLAELRGRYSKVPRICCSDTIDKCLIGITKLKLKDVMYVYRPVGRYQIDWDSPRNACDDWDLTDECWLVTSTTFKFLYAIRPDIDIFTPEISYKRIKGKVEDGCNEVVSTK